MTVNINNIKVKNTKLESFISKTLGAYITTGVVMASAENISEVMKTNDYKELLGVIIASGITFPIDVLTKPGNFVRKLEKQIMKKVSGENVEEDIDD